MSTPLPHLAAMGDASVGGSSASATPLGGSGSGSSSAVTTPSSDAIRSAVSGIPFSATLPLGPETGGEHAYAQLAAETFVVRGPRYLADKAKEPSAPAVFDLMHVELFLSEDKIGNLAQREGSFLRHARAAGDTRFYLLVAYVTPSAPYVHLAFYFAVEQARLDALPHLRRLWARFTARGAEADAFRNERWKVIPRIAEGSWIVQRAVGSKPALLAQKLTHTWILCEQDAAPAAAPAAAAGSGGAATPSPIAAPGVAAVGGDGADPSCGAAAFGITGTHVRGESLLTHGVPGPYLEGDCDVASSTIALMLVGLIQQYAKYIVIDLGFAIEPRAEDECPEAVLGAVRLSRIDTAKPPRVRAGRGDWVLGAQGPTAAPTFAAGDGAGGGEGPAVAVASPAPLSKKEKKAAAAAAAAAEKDKGKR